MRKAIIAALIGLVAIGAYGCDDEKKKAYVEGEFQISTSSDPFNFNGSLAQGGADLYGYCKYSAANDLFEFEVGHASMVDIDTSTKLYVKFTGVEGPPVMGVYEDAVAKIPKEGDVKVAFGTGYIANGGNSFVVPDDDPEDNCYFELFAQADSAIGEVTPIEDQSFSYYVSVMCTGLTGVENDGVPLNSFSGEFYFKGC